MPLRATPQYGPIWAALTICSEMRGFGPFFLMEYMVIFVSCFIFGYLVADGLMRRN